MDDYRDSFDKSAPQVELPHIELIIHDVRGQQTKVMLHKLPAILGREKDVDVQLHDPWVSHRHCELIQVDGVLIVRNLDSKNGIWLHGNRVCESDIRSGDWLTIGRTEILVRYPCGGDAGGTRVISKTSKLESPDTIELLY